MDVFIPVDMQFEGLAEAYEEDKLKPFMHIKNLVEREQERLGALGFTRATSILQQELQLSSILLMLNLASSA